MGALRGGPWLSRDGSEAVFGVAIPDDVVIDVDPEIAPLLEALYGPTWRDQMTRSVADLIPNQEDR